MPPHHHHHHHLPPHPLLAASEHYPGPLIPVSLPTSVAIPNPSLQHSDVLAMYSHGDHSAFSEALRQTSHSPLMGEHNSPNMAHTPAEGMAMNPFMKHDDSFDTSQQDSYDGGHHQISFQWFQILLFVHFKKFYLFFFQIFKFAINIELTVVKIYTKFSMCHNVISTVVQGEKCDL